MITPMRQCITGALLFVLLPGLAMAAEISSQMRVTEFILAQNLPQPSTVELAMWDFAVSSGNPEEIQRFLDLYPDSQFAGDAEILLRALAPEESAAPDTETASETETTQNADIAGKTIVFDQPTVTRPDSNTAVSLAELVEGTPQFPPVEGLPEEYWKDKTCSNCHQWEKDNLCTQAEFYVNQETDPQLRGVHPYGGFFKEAMKTWATDGCQ